MKQKKRIHNLTSKQYSKTLDGETKMEIGEK